MKKILTLITFITLINAVIAEDKKTNKANFTDLKPLLTLKSDEYKQYRDKLVALGDKYDMNDALKESWEMGLAANIINLRIDNKSLFNKYDSGNVAFTAGGDERYRVPTENPNNILQIGPRWQMFVTEQIWKKLWSRELGHYYVKRSFIGVNFIRVKLTPIALWEKVLDSARDPLLKSVAVHALCKDENFYEKAKKLLNDPLTDTTVKYAVISSVKLFKLKFGKDLIVETIHCWKGDPVIREHALRVYENVLGKNDQVGAKKQFLAWLRHNQMPLLMRKRLAIKMKNIASEEDIKILENYLKKKDIPKELRETLERETIPGYYGRIKKKKLKKTESLYQQM
jgi:hypothetical protein